MGWRWVNSTVTGTQLEFEVTDVIPLVLFLWGNTYITVCYRVFIQIWNCCVDKSLLYPTTPTLTILSGTVFVMNNLLTGAITTLGVRLGKSNRERR